MGAFQDGRGAVPSPVLDGIQSCTGLLVVRNTTCDRCVGTAYVKGRRKHASDGSCSVLLWPCPSGGVRRGARTAVGTETIGRERNVWHGEVRLAQSATVYLRSGSPDVDDLKNFLRCIGDS